MNSADAVSGLMTLAGISIAFGFVVLFRTLYRAKGIPRTALEFIALASAALAISVGAAMFYGARQVNTQIQGVDAFKGKPFPQLRYRVNGEDHTSSEWRGHPVLLNLWATWCAPCREELKALGQARSNKRILALSDEDENTVAGFLKETNYTLAIGRITEGAPKLPARPITFAIDASGTVKDVHVGALDTAEIEKLLASY